VLIARSRSCDIGFLNIENRKYGIRQGFDMAHKQVLFRSAAREKILEGCTKLANAVRLTLGPKSKSVLIQKK
jgi:hypothetical protein